MGSNYEVRRVFDGEIIDAHIALRTEDNLWWKGGLHVVQRVVYVPTSALWRPLSCWPVDQSTVRSYIEAKWLRYPYRWSMGEANC